MELNAELDGGVTADGVQRAALLLWGLVKALEALREQGSVPWLGSQPLSSLHSSAI